MATTTRQKRLRAEAAAAAAAAKEAAATLIPEQHQEPQEPTRAELIALIRHQQEQLDALATAPPAVPLEPELPGTHRPRVKEYWYKNSWHRGLECRKPRQAGSTSSPRPSKCWNYWELQEAVLFWGSLTKAQQGKLERMMGEVERTSPPGAGEKRSFYYDI